jgi:hypothetical protein
VTVLAGVQRNAAAPYSCKMSSLLHARKRCLPIWPDQCTVEALLQSVAEALAAAAAAAIIVLLLLLSFLPPGRTLGLLPRFLLAPALPSTLFLFCGLLTAPMVARHLRLISRCSPALHTMKAMQHILLCVGIEEGATMCMPTPRHY